MCVCFWNTELSALISKDPETTTHFNNLPKTMPNWSNGVWKAKYTPWTQYLGEPLEEDVFCVTLSVSSSHCCGGTLAYSCLQRWFSSVFMYRSAKAHHSFHDMVWTSTGPLQHFLFCFFNHSVWYFLFCGHCPAAVLEKLMTASMTTRSCGCKTEQADQIIFCFVFLFVYSSFMWICCDIKPWVSDFEYYPLVNNCSHCRMRCNCWKWPLTLPRLMGSFPELMAFLLSIV